MLVLLTLF